MCALLEYAHDKRGKFEIDARIGPEMCDCLIHVRPRLKTARDNVNAREGAHNLSKMVIAWKVAIAYCGMPTAKGLGVIQYRRSLSV